MMNSFIEQRYEIIEGTQKMRHQLLDLLSDADLRFTPGGSNPTLGGLLRELVDIERSYIDSIKTLKQDWSVIKPNPTLESSVTALRNAFNAQEAEMKQTIAALSEDGLNAIVERGFQVPVNGQMDIYLQALLIAYGRLNVYARALNKELPKQWVEWIA
jgi:uncharacterized damage-inducible protein DinB